MRRKIYYHDTDAGGVVYYANYLKFMEEDRTDYFTDRGFSVTEHAGRRLFYPVRQCSIRYRKPARYGDVIIGACQVTKVNGASLVFDQKILHETTGEVLVEAEVTLVCVDEGFRVMPIPKDVASAFGADP